MTNDLPDLARALLHTLLDRYEQPARQTVVRVRLSAKTHPAYFSSASALPRQATNHALQHLADQGSLRLHWQKWEQGNWLTAVDLLPEQAEVLYRRLGRTPLPRRESDLRALLAAQTPQADWHTAFLDHTMEQLLQHRTVAPLNLDDPRWNADLLALLDAVARLRQPTIERALSVRLFADSKRLADLRGALVTVLRRHAPGADQFGDDERALLQAHMLERIPEYVPLAGPLLLQFATPAGQPGTLDLHDFTQGLALPTGTLQTCTVGACTARVVVTVENATSFHELLAVRPPTMLALYIGGFAGPATLQLLRAVTAACPNVVFYHWGDIDPGGLRILAHLRTHLGQVQPLAMDVATFEQYRRHAQPLTQRDRATLKSLQAHPILNDCSGLIAHLLRSGHKLEQEAVPPPMVELWAEDAEGGLEDLE
ncbi:MAG: Wadjet anti-phage system protein JetD domain-containing protein [Chloroflexaceae bacterium]